MVYESDVYNIVEEVCNANDWLVRTESDFWEYSLVRFDIRSSRSSQNPERIRHLYVKYKTAISVRITAVPHDVGRLFAMCKAACAMYHGEGAAYVDQSIFLRSLKKASEQIHI